MKHELLELASPGEKACSREPRRRLLRRRPDWPRSRSHTPDGEGRLKVAGCLTAVTVVSFLYFAGLIDLRSVQGFQTALLATP